MHLLTGEVAPLAPLLIPIGEIVIWAVALALCLLCVYLAKALFGTASSAVGWIPLFGKVVSRSLTSIEQKIVSFMSEAADASDAKMGLAFHQLARVVDWIGAEINRHANLLLTIAEALTGTAGFAELVRTVMRLRSVIHTAERDLARGIDRVTGRAHAIERGIGHDVLPRIRELEHELARVVGKAIPGLRAGERELEHGSARTWKWIRAHPNALASTAFVGAVGWALSRIGAGWVRCSRWNRIGKQVCGPSGAEFEAFLGLLIAGIAIEDFRTLVKLMQSIEHGSAEAIKAVVKV